MPQKIFKNIIILVFANLLIKPLWIFGIDLKVQNMLGVENYGLYFVVFNFSFLFHILLDLGINQFHNRELAQDNSLLQQRFGQLFALKGFLSLMYFAFSFALALALGYSFLQKKLLFLLAINQMLLSFILFSRANFTALQWYKWDAFFSIFDRILSIIFCAVLLATTFFGQFTILHFIYAQSFALFVSALLSLLLVALKGKVFWPSFSFEALLPLIKQALPYAIVVLLMTIYTRIDAVMLERLLPLSGNEEAGVYAAAYRILDAVNMLPFLLASLLIPFFARKMKENQNYTAELWTAFSLVMACSLSFVMAIFCFHQNLLDWLYPASSKSWNFSFQLLLFSFPAVCISYVFGGLITAAARLKVIGVFAVITIFVNIALNYTWIPTDGATGAALATLISQFLMALFQMLYVIFVFKHQPKLSLVLSIMLYFGLSALILYVLSNIDLHWYYKLAGFAIITIILSFILRLIDIKKIRVL